MPGLHGGGRRSPYPGAAQVGPAAGRVRDRVLLRPGCTAAGCRRDGVGCGAGIPRLLVRVWCRCRTLRRCRSALVPPGVGPGGGVSAALVRVRARYAGGSSSPGVGPGGSGWSYAVCWIGCRLSAGLFLYACRILRIRTRATPGHARARAPDLRGHYAHKSRNGVDPVLILRLRQNRLPTTARTAHNPPNPNPKQDPDHG